MAECKTLNVNADTHTEYLVAVLRRHGTLRGHLQEETNAAIQAHTKRLQTHD